MAAPAAAAGSSSSPEGSYSVKETGLRGSSLCGSEAWLCNQCKQATGGGDKDRACPGCKPLLAAHCADGNRVRDTACWQ